MQAIISCTILFYHKEVRGSDDIERAAVLKYATRPFMAVLLMKVIVVVLFSGLENDCNASGSTSRMPGRLSTCFANTRGNYEVGKILKPLDYLSSLLTEN